MDIEIELMYVWQPINTQAEYRLFFIYKVTTNFADSLKPPHDEQNTVWLMKFKLIKLGHPEFIGCRIIYGRYVRDASRIKTYFFVPNYIMAIKFKMSGKFKMACMIK